MTLLVVREEEERGEGERWLQVVEPVPLSVVRRDIVL